MSKVRIGDRVIFHPRVPYGRQHELFSVITRIVDADEDKVDLISFPTNSEPVHHNNVPRASEAIKVHCWSGGIDEHWRTIVREMDKRIAMLEKRFAGKGQHEAQRLLQEAAAER